MHRGEMKLRDLFSGDAIIGAQHADVAVTGIAVDSRAVKPGDAFFALAGVKTDGRASSIRRLHRVRLRW
jgi:UDP-N-acetylmuramoyl-L-alanyl-D-glutamate--2,6-diaminopimelate ligase